MVFLINLIRNLTHYGNIEKLDMSAVHTSDGDNIGSGNVITLVFVKIKTLLIADVTGTSIIAAREIRPSFIKISIHIH